MRPCKKIYLVSFDNSQGRDRGAGVDVDSWLVSLRIVAKLRLLLTRSKTNNLTYPGDKPPGTQTKRHGGSDKDGKKWVMAKRIVLVTSDADFRGKVPNGCEALDDQGNDSFR